MVVLTVISFAVFFSATKLDSECPLNHYEVSSQVCEPCLYALLDPHCARCSSNMACEQCDSDFYVLATARDGI